MIFPITFSFLAVYLVGLICIKTAPFKFLNGMLGLVTGFQIIIGSQWLTDATSTIVLQTIGFGTTNNIAFGTIILGYGILEAFLALATLQNWDTPLTRGITEV